MGYVEAGVVKHEEYNLIMTKAVYDNLILSYLFVLKPEWSAKIHSSHETFADGIVAHMFNKDIDTELRRYLDYQFGTGYEMHRNQMMMKDWAAVSGRDIIGEPLSALVTSNFMAKIKESGVADF